MALAEARVPGPPALPQEECEQGVQSETEMAQVFMAVRCHACKTFQVQQVKKINKWICKVCNEKQSVVKTYGKGTGKECRVHVQKLNMLRAKKEKEADEKYGGQHPPQDYADTFTTKSGKDKQEMSHPVVLGNSKRSKWTSFVTPQEEDEEEEMGLDVEHDGGDMRRGSTVITKTQVRRALSFQDPVSPYSIISQNSGEGLVNNGSVVSAKSMFFNHDSYTTLDNSFLTTHHATNSASQSMYNLSGSPQTSVAIEINHKERMELIKQDLKRFSRGNDTTQLNHDKRPGASANKPTGRASVPQVSSRWNQFTCDNSDNSVGVEEGRSDIS